MKCPYCDKELREGYISSSTIEWIPNQGVPRMKYRDDKATGFRLGKHSLFGSDKHSAYFCDACNKLIIDCND